VCRKRNRRRDLSARAAVRGGCRGLRVLAGPGLLLAAGAGCCAVGAVQAAGTQHDRHVHHHLTDAAEQHSCHAAVLAHVRGRRVEHGGVGTPLTLAPEAWPILSSRLSSGSFKARSWGEAPLGHDGLMPQCAGRRRPDLGRATQRGRRHGNAVNTPP